MKAKKAKDEDLKLTQWEIEYLLHCMWCEGGWELSQTCTRDYNKEDCTEYLEKKLRRIAKSQGIKLVNRNHSEFI